MKLIKMKVSRNCTPDRTRYTYPNGWVSANVRFGPVYEKGAKERGQDFQWIIFGVEDEHAAPFLAANGQELGEFTFEAAEITREQAIELGEPWIDQVEHIDDPDVVLAVCAKAAKGEALTAEEKDAVNPDKKTKGVSRSGSFTEALDEYIAKSATHKK